MDGDAPEKTVLRRRHSPADMISKLKRAQIFRITVAYAVGAWLIIQVTATISPAFGAPPWLLRLVVLLAMAGFIVTIGFAAASFEPRAVDGSPAKRRKFWQMLIGGALLASLITAGTWVAGRSGLLFGEEKVSIAVLPFIDLSPARDKAYFAEGVAEEILSTLAAEPDFTVLGRSSARQIERSADPKGVRASFGITHLLEGSTRTDGDSLRVNVRLIDTSDGAQLWEEEYQGRLADIFTVQDQIAATVVHRLRGTFFADRVRSAKATSVSTYQDYLAARSLMRTRTEQGLRDALELAKKVVRADPDYAPGHALMAELYFLLSDDYGAYGTIPNNQARKLGIAQARAAIGLDPQFADGHAALGLLLPADQSIQPLTKALQLDSSRADVHVWIGFSLNELGRHDEALGHYRSAAEIDPLGFAPIVRYTHALAAAGQEAAALRTIAEFVRRGGDEALRFPFLLQVANWSNDLSSVIAYGRAGLARGSMRHDWFKRTMAADLHALGFGREAAGILSRTGLTSFHAPFYAGDEARLNSNIKRLGPGLWRAKDGGFAFVHLAARRDWAAIVKLYDAKPSSMDRFCLEWANHAAPFVLALRASGRERDAQAALQCLRGRLAVEARQTARQPEAWPADLEFKRATLSALDGDRAGALQWLERAVARGWLGQPYSSRISDYPQFDLLQSDPKVASLQRRIAATAAKERADVLALTPAA